MTPAKTQSPLETARPLASGPSGAGERHAWWVRAIHWVVSLSFASLIVSGAVILMAHPRLYWGEAGNDLTPALIELPVSRNYKHGGWENRGSFSERAGGAVTANRTYTIFNQNSWGRSLHFLAAWFLVIPGLIYLGAGLATGHFKRNLIPGRGEWQIRRLWSDLLNHFRGPVRGATGGPQYGLLQKWAYFGVIFAGAPLMVITGLAMSPAITAPFPFLSGMFGGVQSARTIHFFAFVLLLLFLIAHVVMVARSGFKRQIRGMTIGESHEDR